MKERWFVLKSRKATIATNCVVFTGGLWRTARLCWHSIAKAISPELLWR